MRKRNCMPKMLRCCTHIMTSPLPEPERLVSCEQVANIVLLEQLYRGYTILRGEKYHH